MSTGWTAEYDNIVEFYFWEPQHLNRGKRAGIKAIPSEVVLSALGRREVPLNHIISIFLSLAPRALIQRWFRSCGLNANEPRLLDYSHLRKRPEFAICQPDLALTDSSGALFCELKIDAKLTVDQIYKYLIFHLASGAAIPLRLLIIGRTADFDAVRQFHESGPPAVSAKISRHADSVGVAREELQAAAARMIVKATRYADLVEFLGGELGKLDKAREPDETLHRLIHDLSEHLRKLGLAPLKASG